MTPPDPVAFIRHMAGLTGLTVEEFARRMDQMDGEQVAQVMERCDTRTLAWAVRFEGMGEGGV